MITPLGRTIALCLAAFAAASFFGTTAAAGVFGEIAASVGGTYPQGSFVRYADPGLLLNLRATAHIPKVEVFVGWADFSFVDFTSEELETRGFIPTEGGTIEFPVTQSYSERMLAAHIGLQLATATQRAFFRPRAAIGIGIYNFSTDMSWDAELEDTTVQLAHEDLDSQTKFGWRGLVGVDFFITTQIGVTADFIYDHVLRLERVDGQQVAERTSRFHGFTVGLVYMFKTP